MAKARKAKEISFTIQQRRIRFLTTTAIAGAKVNITAICAYGWEIRRILC